MNWGQFKDLICYLCLHGTVVSSLSLIQEVMGSRLSLFAKLFYKFCRFYRIHLGNLNKSQRINQKLLKLIDQYY